MSTRVFVLVLVTLLLATIPPAQAQQPSAKVPRIGYLSAALRSADRGEGFRQGLKELGYIEGKSITIEYRFAEGKLDRLSDLAGELVGLKVDVIVATSTPVVVAAKGATREIPIVFNTTGDPWREELLLL